MSILTRRRAARRAERDDWLFLSDLAAQWRWVAEGTTLARTAPCVAGGVVMSVPEVVAVDLGPPLTLTVRLLAGQLAADVAEQGRRLADGLGVATVRVQPARHGYAAVTLHLSDPLGDTSSPGLVELREKDFYFSDSSGTTVPELSTPLYLGRGEDGRRVDVDLATAAHVIVQGATRSGKTVGLYGVLGQLAHLPHVEVTGCDPTGLLLTPWVARGGPAVPTTGTADPAKNVAVLEAFFARMDSRFGAIAPGRDVVDVGSGCPLLVAVLEEWPGLLRVLDGVDRKLGARARAAVSRLLSEGAKAGVRVLMVAQRADANVIGGFERGQASHKITFRVDGPDAVKMLHHDVAPDVVAEHAVAPAGVALLSAPGQPLLRFRAPLVSYGEYVATVAGSVR